MADIDNKDNMTARSHDQTATAEATTEVTAEVSTDVQIEALQDVLKELKATNANLTEQLKQAQLTNQKLLLMTDTNDTNEVGDGFKYFSKYNK